MRIWAVGGGKGGTGKSLVTNGLGTRLAERGFKVILVDTDFGGRNPHHYGGSRKAQPVCVQVLENRKPSEGLALKAKHAGLYLIPGNFKSQNTDNRTTT